MRSSLRGRRYAVVATRSSLCGRRHAVVEADLQVRLPLRHVRILVIARWREGLFDRSRAYPPKQIDLRPRLVVGARRPRAAKWLLTNDSARRFVIDVEVPGRISKGIRRLENRGAIGAEDRPGKRIRRCAINRLERLAPRC